MRLFWLSLLLIPVFYISAQAIDPSSVTDRRAQLESELAGIDNKIEREKDSLSELLRELYQIDQSSMVEMLLCYDNLSEFFVQADSFDAIQRSLQQSFKEIRANKSE